MSDDPISYYESVSFSMATQTQYIEGVDVSKWQGTMDWQKCRDAGARYAGIRCTVGDYYFDPEFERNWDGAKAAGLKVVPYHVVVPTISADKQMTFFIENFTTLRIPDFPYVLDCERVDGQNPRTITAVTQNCVNFIADNWGEYPIIYTAQGYWNANIFDWSGWEKCPLWVANYTTADKPAMPKDWDDWQMWQWSADGNGMGPTYGADGSQAIDLNRMKPEFWEKYSGDAPEPEPEPEDKLFVTVRQKGVCYEGWVNKV